jgi:hypothetical protein
MFNSSLIFFAAWMPILMASSPDSAVQPIAYPEDRRASINSVTVITSSSTIMIFGIA